MANTLPPVPIGEPADSFAWQQWYIALGNLYSGTGTIAWSLVSKTGSDLADLVIRNHASLQSIQGGIVGERYHLSVAQLALLTGVQTANTVFAGPSSGATAAPTYRALVPGDMVHSQTSKSVAGAVDVTLTTAESMATILQFTGIISANINVIVPTSVRQWTVFNNTTGAFTLTVKTTAGTGIVIATAKTAILYCDGTNVVRATADV